MLSYYTITVIATFHHTVLYLYILYITSGFYFNTFIFQKKASITIIIKNWHLMT